MWIKPSATALVLLLATQPATAQPSQPNVQMLAQAYDRCMATYAVRLTRTAAADAEIYSQAKQSCAELDGQLKAALSAQLQPAQAAEIIQSMDAQAEPNFMAMLAQIRSDRARRGGN